MPGERAIEKMIDEMHAVAIRRMVAEGVEPAEAMVHVWGREGLRDRIKRSRMTAVEKLMGMHALENWEARQAVASAEQGGSPYRSMTVRPEPQPRRKGWLRRCLERVGL